MKNHLRLFAIALSCILFSACPYKSSFPLEAPKSVVKENYLGNWVDLDDMTSSYNVSMKSTYLMRIEAHGMTSTLLNEFNSALDSVVDAMRKAVETEKNSKSSEDTLKTNFNYSTSLNDTDGETYTGYISKLKGKLFLNLELENQEGWYLFKVEGKGDRINLFAVADEIKRDFMTMKEWRAYVAKHVNEEDFYDKPIRLKRK